MAVMGCHHRHLGWTSHQRPATFRNVQRGTTDWEMAAPEVVVVVVVVVVVAFGQIRDQLVAPSGCGLMKTVRYWQWAAVIEPPCTAPGSGRVWPPRNHAGLRPAVPPSSSGPPRGKLVATAHSGQELTAMTSEVKGMELGTWHPPDMLGNRTEEMAPRMSVEGCHFSADSQPRLWFPQIW